LFYRNIIEELRNWAKNKARKPLILRGARQVGKTTAVKIFAKEFDTFVHLNLENREDLEIFSNNLDVNDLIQLILLTKNVREKRGKTLVFIDEIQNSPEAVAMMRYFYELKPEYFIIGAGSLLEIMMENKKISFPVGRVEYRFMYPLTFEEFLKASGNEIALEYYGKVPSQELAHSKLLSLFHTFSMVGGMPEVVQSYINSNELVLLKVLYQALNTSYLDDVSKYAKNSSAAEIIRFIVESAPFEAGKRIKFQGFGNSNYRSREVGEALRTLERAMVINLIYPTTANKPPALINRKKSPRLQFIDTGLMNFAVGLQAGFFKFKDLHSFYQGIIAEHMVGQELIGRDMISPSGLKFWVKEQKQSNAEVDFIVPFNELLIPVEVKSGKSGTLRSLHQFINMAEHGYAVRCYSGPLTVEDAKTPSGKKYKLLSLPYYLAGKIDSYLEWFL